MSVATAGAKSAVIDQLESLVPLADNTRAALEKLNIKEILFLIKDIEKAVNA